MRWSGAGRRFFAGRMPIVFYHGIWPAGAPALARFEGTELDTAAPRSDGARRSFRLRQPGGSPEQRRERGERPPLAVCFDDGCDMMRSGAIDVLDALGVPATMFVVTACVDNRHLMWMHKLQAIAVTSGADRLVQAYNQLMAETGAGPNARLARRADRGGMVLADGPQGGVCRCSLCGMRICRRSRPISMSIGRT